MNFEFDNEPESKASRLGRLEEDLYVTQRAYDKGVLELRTMDVMMTSARYQNRMGKILELWWQLLELEDEIKKEITNAEENK